VKAKKVLSKTRVALLFLLMIFKLSYLSRNGCSEKDLQNISQESILSQEYGNRVVLASLKECKESLI
jgi:hypothetical protein